jgi:hypothetical protein
MTDGAGFDLTGTPERPGEQVRMYGRIVPLAGMKMILFSSLTEGQRR